MPKRAPAASNVHATLYDFRDLDIMYRLAENNGKGISSLDIAEELGFDREDGARPIGIRLAWMRRYGMVAFDETNRLWKLSKGGQRVTAAHLRAPQLKVVNSMDDEAMVEVMAHVTSRFQRGEPMIAHMLRREFQFGTQRR